MKNILHLFLFLSFLSCQSKMSLANLETQIQLELTVEKGIFAVAFKDLSTGKELLVNAHESFHAASTMKTPVMIEVFRQKNEEIFSQQDSILVKNEFYSIIDSSIYTLSVSEDSESELYDKIGTKKSIADLVYDMIIVSSNLATNIIVELVDAKKVTQTMRTLGAPDINVLRGVEDIKAYEKGMSNSTTAYDLMVIYEKMAKGETVNTDASQKMISILLDQKFNNIIPAHLPAEVKVAHKTGSITGVHHDAGIVFLPDGRKYVLVLLSKELQNSKEGTTSLAKVSKMVYEYIQK